MFINLEPQRSPFQCNRKATSSVQSIQEGNNRSCVLSWLRWILYQSMYLYMVELFLEHFQLYFLLVKVTSEKREFIKFIIINILNSLCYMKMVDLRTIQYSDFLHLIVRDVGQLCKMVVFAFEKTHIWITLTQLFNPENYCSTYQYCIKQ